MIYYYVNNCISHFCQLRYAVTIFPEVFSGYAKISALPDGRTNILQVKLLIKLISHIRGTLLIENWP